MSHNFENIFLVCIDYGDDLNYVVARNPSLKKAREAASLAKKKWPERDVYITVEKCFVEELNTENAPNSPKPYMATSGTRLTERCACGKSEGSCLSNLSCRCPAIAKCKQMRMDIAPPHESNNGEPAEIHVINIRRGIIEVVIPDWNPEEVIGLSPSEIPEEVKPYLEPGIVLEADLNLEASSPDELSLQNIRLVYEDDEDEDYDSEEDDEDEDYDKDGDEISMNLQSKYLLPTYKNPFLNASNHYELPGDQEEFESGDVDFVDSDEELVEEDEDEEFEEDTEENSLNKE